MPIMYSKRTLALTLTFWLVAAANQIGSPRCVWPAGAELGEGTLWSVRHQVLFWVDILGRHDGF